MGSETRAFSLYRYYQINANKNTLGLTLVSIKVEINFLTFLNEMYWHEIFFRGLTKLLKLILSVLFGNFELQITRDLGSAAKIGFLEFQLIRNVHHSNNTPCYIAGVFFATSRPFIG